MLFTTFPDRKVLNNNSSLRIDIAEREFYSCSKKLCSDVTVLLYIKWIHLTLVILDFVWNRAGILVLKCQLHNSADWKTHVITIREFSSLQNYVTDILITSLPAHSKTISKQEMLVIQLAPTSRVTVGHQGSRLNTAQYQ